jgi:hypothetical protein
MTVDLKTTAAKVVFWVLVVVCGALGGFTADLVKTRKIGGRDEEGVIERSAGLGQRYLDLGTIASLIVGAVAAAVAVWIFDIVNTVTIGTGTAAKTVDQYGVIQLVGVSLIVGFSGPKFLQTAAERTLALVDSQHLETALRSGLAASTAARQAPAVAGGAPETASAVEHHATVVEAIAHEALQPGSVTKVKPSGT